MQPRFDPHAVAHGQYGEERGEDLWDYDEEEWSELDEVDLDHRPQDKQRTVSATRRAVNEHDQHSVDPHRLRGNERPHHRRVRSTELHHYHHTPRHARGSGQPPAGQQVQIHSSTSPAPPSPPAAPGPAAPAPNSGWSAGETLQMIMMNGMMMQQMQAQQMQAAQMAAMVKGSSGDEPRRRDYDGCGQGSCPAVQGSTTVTVRGANVNKKSNKQRKGIATHQQVTRQRPIAIPVIKAKKVPTFQPSLIVDTSPAFDNWQEATILMSIMVIALIYLITSRAAGAGAPSVDNKKDRDDARKAAAKHLAG